MGNVFMIAYFFRNVHGKLSLFLIKTSNNSNATRHQKLSIYYFDKKLVVPV